MCSSHLLFPIPCLLVSPRLSSAVPWFVCWYAIRDVSFNVFDDLDMTCSSMTEVYVIRHVDWERRSVAWSESLLDVSEGQVIMAFILFVIWHDDGANPHPATPYPHGDRMLVNLSKSWLLCQRLLGKLVFQ
jgi:hypothetical protein